MQWTKVRECFPKTWVLIEAIAAHDENDKRILDEIAVVDRFDESGTAWKAYSQLKTRYPQRELLIAHTMNEILDITIQHWAGFRGRA